MYVIEDLRGQPFPETPTTLDVLREFEGTGHLQSPFIKDADTRYLEETIDRVEIRRPNHSELAVVYKKPA
jgi:hypothetical protein